MGENTQLRRAVTNIAAAITSLLAVSTAAAAPFSIEPGSWRVDRVRQQVTAEPWSHTCGAKPQSHDWKISADEFEVTLVGDEAHFKSKRRRLRTDGCEGSSTGLKAVRHEAGGDFRETRCVAPSVNDMAAENVVHRFVIVDATHVLYTTEGSKQILPPGAPKEEDGVPLGEVRKKELVWFSDGTQWRQGTRAEAQMAQRCVLNFKKEEKLEWLPAKAANCAGAGPARNLKLEPATFDIKAVSRTPLCFKIVAEDVEGCPTKAPAVNWSVDPVGLVGVDEKGCITLDKGEQEAVVAVSAQSLGLRANALVRIVPAPASGAPEAVATDFATLAERSQSARVKEVVKELVGEISVGALNVRSTTPEAVAASPSREHAETEASYFNSYLLIVAIAAFAGVCFAIIYAIKRRRRLDRERAAAAKVRKEKSYKEAEMAKKAELPQLGKGLVCPKCQFEFENGEFCPYDQTRLIALDHEARHTLFIPIVGGMICPVCGERYPAKARFCGKDRSPLVPDRQGS